MNQAPDLNKARDGAALSIQKAEGYRRDVYRDVLKKRSLVVGWGHLVLPEDGLALGDDISDFRAETFLELDMRIAVDAVSKQYGEQLSEMNAPRTAVLIEMAYVLGANGLQDFKDMQAAIDSELWTLAGDEIIDSKWFKVQGARLPGIKSRALRLRRQMSFGEWQ